MTHCGLTNPLNSCYCWKILIKVVKFWPLRIMYLKCCAIPLRTAFRWSIGSYILTCLEDLSAVTSCPAESGAPAVTQKPLLSISIDQNDFVISADCRNDALEWTFTIFAVIVKTAEATYQELEWHFGNPWHQWSEVVQRWRGDYFRLYYTSTLDKWRILLCCNFSERTISLDRRTLSWITSNEAFHCFFYDRVCWASTPKVP